MAVLTTAGVDDGTITAEAVGRCVFVETDTVGKDVLVGGMDDGSDTGADGAGAGAQPLRKSINIANTIRKCLVFFMTLLLPLLYNLRNYQEFKSSNTPLISKVIE